MATLERIRRRSGLLIVVIGIAILGFILTDLLGSGDSIFRGDATVVGKVNGRAIEYNRFSQLIEEQEAAMAQQNPEQARSITRKQLADAVWEELLREELMGEQYDELGLRITSAELYNRLKSNPSIRQGFTDESGRFNEMRFQQYLGQIRDNRDIDPEAARAYEQWLDFESNVKTNALQSKYNKAVEMGLYVPTGVAKEMHGRRSTQKNAQVAALEYSGIADDAVTVEEKDLKTYYETNKQDFKTEQTAAIQYVSFPVSASNADRGRIQNELRGYLEPEIVEVRGTTDTLESFATSENDSLFAAARSDRRVMGNYYTKEELPRGLDTSIFEQPVGHIAGPYSEGDFYTLTKLVDKKTLPDSVNARHILISFQGIEGGNQQRTYEEAEALADSILDIVREDSTKFTQLAQEYSDDPGSGSRGGELGWFGKQQMVRPFSNFAFRNEEGEIGRVMSQFGIHIIEILEQKGENETVKLFNISLSIEPTDETIDSVYNKASSLAASIEGANDFAEKAEENGYTPRPVKNLKPFDENIAGLGNNRQVIQWAHNEDTEVGEIQLFDNRSEAYVVVMLTDFQEEGYRSFEAVKEEIRPIVVNQKKAEQLKQKFAEAKQNNDNFEAIANAAGSNISNQTISFGSSALSGYGDEPKVIGAITALEPNVISDPIEGNRGVYLAQVTGEQPAQELPSYASEQQQQAQSTRGLVNTQLFRSLKENAKVEDRRAKFF